MPIFHLQAALTAAFNGMVGSLEDSLQTLNNMIEAMSNVIEVDKLCASVQHKFSQIGLSSTAASKPADPAHAISMDALQEDIAKWLDSSYQFTFWQLRTVIQKKVSYFAELRL